MLCLYSQIVCNLLTYARHIMCSEEGIAADSAVLEGGAVMRLLALLQHLVRAHHHHEKLLATTMHQLHNLPTCSLDGQYTLQDSYQSLVYP